MKKLIVMFLFIPFFISYTPIEQEPITIIETETIIETVTEYIEVEDTEKIEILENELDKYKSLISNLNELLSFVYYGYASNNEWVIDGFTAFSMVFNDKAYIVTVGHAVELGGLSMTILNLGE